MARFLHLVVEHKHRIGFTGTDPHRAQAGRAGQAPVRPRRRHGGRVPGPPRPGRRDPAQPGGQPRHAGRPQLPPRGGDGSAAGVLGSIDANRGDPQNGWDTDQFPNSVEECTLVLYEILAAGGFTTGGVNFDTKLRRQSVARDDLFHGHIGAMDTMARSLLAAASLLESGDLARFRPGALRRLGRSVWVPASWTARRTLGRPAHRGSPTTGSTRPPCRAARSCWSTW